MPERILGIARTQLHIDARLVPKLGAHLRGKGKGEEDEEKRKDSWSYRKPGDLGASNGFQL